MATLIQLRDLPGVQGVVELCRSPRNFDHLTRAYTMEKVNDVSIGLFGITAWETELEDGDEFEDMTPEEYEANFSATKLPWPEAEPFWHALGWDISDGQGAELNCAHLFARQIIAAEGDLVEGARFTPDGSGVPFEEGGEPANEQRLAESLQRDAARFLRDKGRSS